MSDFGFPYDVYYSNPVDTRDDRQGRTLEDNKLFVCNGCNNVWQYKTHTERRTTGTISSAEYYGLKNHVVPSYGKKRVICPQCKGKVNE